MAAIGIALAIFFFLTVAAFIDEAILHTKGAGRLLGRSAGIAQNFFLENERY
jgi:hypothetical protein